MKIAYFSGAEIPSRGANSMHVMRMCQAFAELSHEVTLYVGKGELAAEDDHAFYGVKSSFDVVKHQRSKRRVVGALAHAWAARRTFLERPRPDLIYAREYYVLAATARTGVPFVFESHWKPKHIGQERLEGWFFAQPGFRRLVVISDALRRVYLDMYRSLSAAQVVVAHDAADPVTVGAPRSKGPLAVGYVGSFFRGYGVELLPPLARALPNVNFHVIGGSADDVAAARANGGTLPNLEYHGFVPPSELPRLYAQLDVMLAPYQRSTPHIDWISPMKLFEYMANEKAIVCSDFPVMREVLTDHEDALLVRPEAMNEWQSAIEQLSVPEFRHRMASAARAKLEAKHTWRKRAEMVLSGLTRPSGSLAPVS